MLEGGIGVDIWQELIQNIDGEGENCISHVLSTSEAYFTFMPSALPLQLFHLITLSSRVLNTAWIFRFSREEQSSIMPAIPPL
ncbi:hypothetical protein VTK56DRAFT_9525 [Thermocarpiscus australiensis]